MNSSNETYFSLDTWFSLFQFPLIGDIICAYILTPVWLLSLIFSLFSLFILFKPAFFASNFFSFIRLYVINCLILSVLASTAIFASTRRIFSITNTYEANFYGVYVYFTAHNSLVLYSNSIEICLVVERILYLLPARYRRIKLIGFKKFFFILFIVCILVNIPGIFLFEPAYADVPLDKYTQFRIWHFGVASFSNTSIGVALNYCLYIFRNILPMTCEIILNIVSVYLVGTYVKNKQKIKGTTLTASAQIVNFDRKQTYVALVMSTLSLFEHIFYISSFVLFFFQDYYLCAFFYTLALLFIAIKHFLVFFIILTFNNLFRNQVKRAFKLGQS